MQSGSVKQEYIDIENRELVTAIRDRHFAAAALKILSENIRAQERTLQKYRGYSPDCIMPLLGKTYRSINSTDEKRSKKKAGGMKFRDDELIHRTTFGLMVRSKSEPLIAEVLHDRGIDFRYEKVLRLYDEYE